MSLSDKYRDYCLKKGISFQSDTNVSSYDETTLFCPAGMQQFKPKFLDKSITNLTIGNIQSCIRLNDEDEIDDGTHFLYFNMMGLFSFRHWSLKESIDFWMEFIEKECQLKVDYITIHPNKYDEWGFFYQEYQVEIRPDKECTWTDGIQTLSYCTEFYIDDIEIGNIVNNNGDCIDVGFGLERIETLIHKKQMKLNIYYQAIKKIAESGFVPGPNKQGYILRKLLRTFVNIGGTIPPEDSLYQLFTNEIKRQDKLKVKYERLKKKHPDKPKEWFYDTHGIDENLF